MDISKERYKAPADAKFYRCEEPLRLELGGELPSLQIAYNTYGRLNEQRDNVVWVCHALTANSDVTDWWPHTVEEGCFLDPGKWFVVCANILGSPYGTTAPLHLNPATGEPYYNSFPRITIRDMISAHRLLARHLGIDRIHALVGCSVGGFQATEWAVTEPGRFDRLVFLATDAKASPWAIAINETQRMSIMADASYGEPRDDAASRGLAAARALGLLSYRGPAGYNITQQDKEELPEVHRACSYQQYQGEKLVRRFDAYSYVSILDAFDTHDIGRGRGGTDAMLQTIECPTVVVGLTTDILFTPTEMKSLASRIPGAIYREIHSPFGHDGFLVEYGQLNEILVPFLAKE
jgi:homoserine O-acetyltransferase